MDLAAAPVESLNCFEQLDETLLKHARDVGIGDASRAVAVFCSQQQTAHLSSSSAAVILLDTGLRRWQAQPEIETIIDLQVGLGFLVLAGSVYDESFKKQCFAQLQEVIVTALNFRLNSKKSSPSRIPDTSNQELISPLETIIALTCSALVNIVREAQDAPTQSVNRLLLKLCFLANFTNNRQLSEIVSSSCLQVLEWVTRAALTSESHSGCETIRQAYCSAMSSAKQSGGQLPGSANPRWLTSRDPDFMLLLLGSVLNGSVHCARMALTSAARAVQLIEAITSRVEVVQGQSWKKKSGRSTIVKSTLTPDLQAWAKTLEELAPTLSAEFPLRISKATGNLLTLACQLNVSYECRQTLISSYSTLVDQCGLVDGITEIQCEALKKLVLAAGKLNVIPEMLKLGSSLLSTLQAHPDLLVQVGCVYFDALGGSLWAATYNQTDDGSHLRNYVGTDTDRCSGSAFLSALRRSAFAALNTRTSAREVGVLEVITRILKDRLSQSSKRNASVAAMAEGMEAPKTVVARKAMANIWSCFGSDLVLRCLPACALVVEETALTSTFLSNSGMWAIEALADCCGRLDAETYVSRFIPLIEYAAERSKDASSDVAIATWQAVRSQLKESLPFFMWNPANLQVTLGMIENIESQTYSLEDLSILAKGLERLLISLKSMSNEVEAQKARQAISLKVASWGVQIAESPRMTDIGRRLLQVSASTCDPSNVPEIVSLLATKWVQRLQGNESLTVPVETYVELTCAACESGFGNKDLAARLTVYVAPVSKLIGSTRLNPVLQKAYYRFLEKILELYVSADFGDFLNVEPVIHMLMATQRQTPSYVWKFRVKFHEAVLRFIERLAARNLINETTGQRRDFIMNYLLQGPLFESCWKSSSITAVTRRRAYRVSVRTCRLILQLSGSGKCNKDLLVTSGYFADQGTRSIATVVLGGCSVVDSITIQQGFAKGLAKILEAVDLPLNYSWRKNLESALEQVTLLVYSPDSKSTKSSVLGSAMSKSTRFTRKMELKNRKISR